MRRSETPGEAPDDPLTTSLKAAAHLAVERGDFETVAALMALLEQRRAPKAGAAG